VQGHGTPNPTYVPEGQAAMEALARRLAEATGDYAAAGGSWFEVFDVPMTAHFLGGVTIGSTPERGVVDAYHRVWGHPGISVVDGSAVSANLGVNPALTITAQAERALALWPNRGETDARPSQAAMLAGRGYAVLAPVPPRHPAVPGFLDPVGGGAAEGPGRGGAGAGPVDVAAPGRRVSVPGATMGG
jgi:cholesterol oxidase